MLSRLCGHNETGQLADGGDEKLDASRAPGRVGTAWSLMDGGGEKEKVVHKKPFSCSSAARAGTIGFSWMPDENPLSYFYYYGRQLYFDLHGHPAPFDPP
jgi:hypothetical protein